MYSITPTVHCRELSPGAPKSYESQHKRVPIPLPAGSSNNQNGIYISWTTTAVNVNINVMRT